MLPFYYLFYTLHTIIFVEWILCVLGLMMFLDKYVSDLAFPFYDSHLNRNDFRNICYGFIQSQFCRDDYYHWFDFGETLIF